MSNTIKVRNSTTVVSQVPSAPVTMVYGELALNYATGYESLFIKNAANTIITLNDWSHILNKPSTLVYSDTVQTITGEKNFTGGLTVNSYGVWHAGNLNPENFPLVTHTWGAGYDANTRPTDANSFIKMDYYWANIPVNSIGILKQNVYSSDWFEQEFTSLAGVAHDKYWRSFYGGTTFDSWRKIWDSGNSNLSTVDWNAKNLYATQVNALNNNGTAIRGESPAQNYFNLQLQNRTLATDWSKAFAIIQANDGWVGFSTNGHYDVFKINADGSSSFSSTVSATGGITSNYNSGTQNAFISNSIGRSWVFGQGIGMGDDDYFGFYDVTKSQLPFRFSNSSAIFSGTVTATTAKLSNLTAGYLPYHTLGGLANSGIWTDGTNFSVGGNLTIKNSSSLNILGNTADNGRMALDPTTDDWRIGWVGTPNVVTIKQSNGNVGIGTTVPGSMPGFGKVLQISGVDATGNASVRLTGTTGSWEISNNGLNVLQFYRSASDIALSIDNASNAILAGNLIVSGTGNTTINGNVGIGIINPGVELDVAGRFRVTGSLQSSTAFTLHNTNAAFNNSLFYGYTDRPATSAFKFLDLRANGVQKCYVDGFGTGYFGGSITSNYSHAINSISPNDGGIVFANWALFDGYEIGMYDTMQGRMIGGMFGDDGNGSFENFVYASGAIQVPVSTGIPSFPNGAIITDLTLRNASNLSAAITIDDYGNVRVAGNLYATGGISAYADVADTVVSALALSTDGNESMADDYVYIDVMTDETMSVSASWSKATKANIVSIAISVLASGGNLYGEQYPGSANNCSWVYTGSTITVTNNLDGFYSGDTVKIHVKYLK